MGSSNLNSIGNSHNNDGHGNIPRIFVSDDDDDNDIKNDDEPVDNDQRNLLLTGELGFPALTKEPGDDFDQR